MAKGKYRGASGATGDAAKDGYTCIERRPRTRMSGYSRMVPHEEANRIEELEREWAMGGARFDGLPMPAWDD